MGDVQANDSLRGIAIIGMSGRFPKARNLDEFWRNLREGVDCISSFSDEELKLSGVGPALISHPAYVKRKAFLEDIDLFDALFFGFNPGEAEIMDPQQRLFLECAYEGMETAGYTSEGYDGLIGVYAGCSMNSYLINNLLPNKEVIQRLGGYQVFIGNDKDFLTTRVSYKLNLKGASIDVQTACSTSLVAVHLACQSLLNYECDMAIAGGVSIGVPQKTGYLYQEGMILSPDGFCRAFDAKAQGTIGGEGVGVVILKRLTDALADGDCIRAVIKGSAINNDGSLKAGYTAPSIDGQAEVIATAQAAAGIKAETISYVETHGTGTPLGDPIEIAALTKAFRYGTEKKRFCAIGSLKTNIGHLDIAAGVASLIKTLLAIQHKLLPPSLHFKEPNPLIDFNNSPFYVNTDLSDWKAGESPRRAGVSSFGIGGTNVHLIVEEAPDREGPGPSRQWQLLTLSAKTDTALATMTKELVEQLKKDEALNLADVAYTLQVGRRRFGNRRIAVCQTLDDAVLTLDTMNQKEVVTAVNESENRPVVFMFSGQGSQYVNMALDLYERETTFREQVDFCSEFLKPHLGSDLRDVLYPDKKEIEKATHRLTQTAITQPALFVVEYALAKLWEEWGIRPQAMIGHSIGEYVAACLAGVFSLEEALALVAARGRLIQALPGGAMMAIPMPEQKVLPLLNEKLSLAAVNAPSLCVVSGTKDAIGALENALASKGVSGIHLHTSHAFHSKMMEPIFLEFIEQVRKVTLKPPQMRYMSNVTGTWITKAEATDPTYWAKHIRQTVRFADGVAELMKDSDAVLLEVGPGRTLVTLVEQHINRSAHRVVLSSLRHPKEPGPDDAFLLKTLGRLWLEGAKVDWNGFYRNQRRHRVPLPTYPFERQRYWVEPRRDAADSETRTVSFQKKREISDWFYIPSWKRSAMPKPLQQEPVVEGKSCWLVFHDQHGLGHQLVNRLVSDGQDVVSVIIGDRFARLSQTTYTVNPYSDNDYATLLSELSDLRKVPNRIIHLWSVKVNGNSLEEINSPPGQEQLGFYSLLFLAQALADLHLEDRIEIDVVSNNMQEVSGEEVLQPEIATILGPCKTIPQENPKIKCRSIDLSCNTQEDLQKENLVDQLLQEIISEHSDAVVAYRGPHRWLQIFEQVQLNNNIERLPSLLKMKGVYLITGGLGGIGLVLAEYLARTVSAKLVLIGRSNLPPKESWAQWLITHGEQDALSRKMRRLQTLENSGAEVLAISADVCDLQQMEEAARKAFDRFGHINGIIHAAGIAGGSIIQSTTREAAEAVLAPKVKGTQILHTIFKEKNIDFVVYCSSINSILAIIGQTAYCAANAFLDAFATANNSVGGALSISINWDTWQEVGMAVDTEVPIEFREIRETNLQTGILSKEGIEVFCRTLDSKLPQVVISTRDLKERIQALNYSAGSMYELQPEKEVDSSRSKHLRPKLSSEFVPPRNEIEQTIAEVWQELLSIEKIGINDNFFELGGHSLLGTQVLSRIYQLFNIHLPLRRLFEASTIERLGRLIEPSIKSTKGGQSVGGLPSEEREVIEI